MKNHELSGWTVDNFDGMDTDGNTDPYAYDVESFGESDAYDYEKSLDGVDYETLYFAEHNANRLLADLTWRGIGGSPRERYNDEHRQTEIDRLRLFKEAEMLHDFDFRRDYKMNGIPESKFLRHLAETCEEGGEVSKTIPLSESEMDHFQKTSGNFIKYLSYNNNKERSFARYLQSLVKMCESAYGKQSRAEMYLCDDLNQLLSSENSKSRIMDRLIYRKIETAQKIAMGEQKDNTGFTGALDLPDGIEKKTIEELINEGVPSLYGY